MATTEGGRGYPPMETLQGAVPGWHQPWLSAAATREQAAAVLRAESHTSVLDQRGLRRLWWREVFFVAALVRRCGASDRAGPVALVPRSATATVGGGTRG